MKETRADTQRALVEAIGLHVVLFGLLFAGLQWSRDNTAEPAAGEPIEADLVDPSALSAAMRSALQRAPDALPAPVVEAAPAPEPVEAPIPEPLPQPMAEDSPPAPVPDPAPVEQPKVQRDAPAPDPALVRREQEAKRRQQQADLDAQQQADADRQKQQQLADLRKQREQAARERTQAEMRAQQLADARNAAAAAAQSDAAASRPPGNRGIDANLRAQYAAAIQQAIARQWIRPESVQLGLRCSIAIRQLPGGEVVDVTVAPSCPFDELGRQSVERAVLKASPLPYAGFESVFDRNLTVNFQAEDR